MNKKFVNFFVMILVLLICTSCQKDEIIEENLQNNNINQENNLNIENTNKSNEIVLSMRTTQNLNPLINEDESVDNILKLMFEPLIAIDSNFKPQPAIAESWSFSEKGNVISINIKDNIYWHNGNKITVDDVIFSINTIKNAPQNSVYKSCVSNIISYTKTSNTSLNITFLENYIGNIYYLTFPIISSNYYGNGGLEDDEKKLKPLGNGIYEFKSFIPAKELRLIKANNNFGKEALTNEVCINITPDKDTDLYSFDQGILDVISADITDMAKYDTSDDRQISEYSTNYIDYIGFNWNRKIFFDKNLRKAFAFVLPKENIIESVYLSHAEITNTMINPSSWLYEENVVNYNYNIEHAKTLLDESGFFDVDDDGIREKIIDGKKYILSFSILVNSENDERKQIASKFMEGLKAIGVNAVIESVSYDEYVERLNSKNFDIYIGGIKQSIIPDLTYILGTHGDMNFSSYSDETMDNLLHLSKTAINDNDMKLAFSNLQKYIADEVAYIPVAYRNSAIFANKRIGGELSLTETNVYGNIYKWYLK